MATVNQEIVQVKYSSVIGQYGGQLIFPSDWVLADLAKEMLAMPSEADLFAESVSQHYPIGTQLRKNGNLYRYCKAGAEMVAGSRGFLKGNYSMVPGNSGEGFEGAFYAAVVAGDTSFKIADTGAVKNEYENGLLVIYDDTLSIYDQYTIIGNDASDGTTTTCYIAPPGFKSAHAVSGTTVDVYWNEYRNVRSLLSVGAAYVSALGYVKFAITSAYYFWLQTAGRISGVTGASTWPGQTAYQRDVYCNTDGSLIGITSTTYLYQRVGFLLHRTASTYGDNTIMLQLDQ